MRLARRTCLRLGAAAGALALGSTVPRAGLRAQAAPSRPDNPAVRTIELDLVAAERPGRPLGAAGPEVALWTYDATPVPVIRMRQGDTLVARLENRLAEHTSIHWHGIRLPNAMDGVQYITQPPVEPGQRFEYRFTPPDTGTFFFHPHCNETGQVGRGLAGVLLVEGDEPEPYDADLVLAHKDWRLDDDGRWLPFSTPQGAARAGTFGTRRSVNLEADYRAEVPASADVRLRVLNLDGTRMVQLGVEGAEAYVIATDGNPVTPFPLDTWRLGAAMRVDLLVRTPPDGGSFRLIDYYPAETWTLATLAARGAPVRQGRFEPRPLHAGTVPVPDLANAERLPFVFGAAAGSPADFVAGLPEGEFADRLLDDLCVTDTTFWAINKRAWPNDAHRAIPPPLATLVDGRSYVFELMNATPHPHPIHLHGHTFQVLDASRQELPRFDADTVLLQPKERIQIAFVARTGAWMFHCHILEHLEHGMMGWLDVT